MSSKHKRTHADIFKRPVPSDIQWQDVMNLLKYLDAEVSEGSGSRVRVRLNNRKAVLHKPHPRKQMDRGSVQAVREFLENAGVKKI